MSIQYGQEQEDEEQRQQVQSVKRRDLLNRISRSVNSWVELVKKLEIPRNLLEESDGLILVQAFKFGILASVSYGNGILLVQNRRSRWTSTPCMISISGIGFGLQFGLCKESFALVLTDKSVIHTLAQGRDFSFGKSVEITVGPTKLDDQYQISEREHLGGKTYVYAKKNGVYIAAALNATILSSRRKSNGILYDNLTTEEILEGDRADVPEEFLPLIQVIKDQTHDNPSYDQE